MEKRPEDEEPEADEASEEDLEELDNGEPEEKNKKASGNTHDGLYNPLRYEDPID